MNAYVAKPSEKKDEKKYYDNQEVKIRKGQAFNLAVAAAIDAGKADDAKFIFSKFIQYYDLAALIQSSSIDDLKELLNE